jgi:hypothetical protein
MKEPTRFKGTCMPSHRATNVSTDLKVIVLEESSADRNRWMIHCVKMVMNGKARLLMHVQSSQ